MKKTVQKFRWTVPLIMIQKSQMTHRDMIPGEIQKILNMNISAKTKIENVLTCWSVAQAGSNYEKMGVQNLVGLSL